MATESCGRDLQQSDGWRKLWRLSIPQKIKVLLWRLCRNTIPVRYLLRSKSIRVPIGCTMCVGDVEHLRHLFLDCGFAKECWQSIGLSYNTWDVEYAHVWLLDKLCSESEENLIKIATVIWGIWWARNKRVWDNVAVSAEIAMVWSSKQIAEWREAQKRKLVMLQRQKQNSVQHAKKWKAPAVGKLKLNVDASVFDGANHFSIGMVVRDHQGHFICGKTMKIAGSVSVLEAETVGILEALQWLEKIPGQVSVVESDSLMSVNAVNKQNQNRMELGNIVEQCRSIMGNNNGVSVVFVRKHANKVAHLLARLPCTLNSFVDYSSPPLNVLETLMSDV